MTQHDASQPRATGRARWSAILTAAAVLALPVAYLVSYYAFPGSASADASGIAAPAIGTSPPAHVQPAVASTSNADAQINQSLSYIRANQPGRALPILDAVVAQDPHNAVAWNNRCVAHTMLMLYAAGIADCERALRIDPGFQLAKNNLKWAQDELAKTQQAVAQQEQTGLPARNEQFYLQEGLNFLHIGSDDQAIKAWQRALSLNPKSAVAANNLGTAYMEKHDPKTASTWFSRAIELDPTLQIARNNLAWAQSELAHSASAPQPKH